MQTSPPQPPHTFNQITMLCSELSSCDESSEHLGYLSCKQGAPTQVHVHNTPVKPAAWRPVPVRTHELQTSGLTLPHKQRLEIGASLCWAVLLLSNTNWLSADLPQDELQLLLDSSIAGDQDHLQGTFVSFRHGSSLAGKVPLPLTLAIDSAIAAAARNRTLFILGIILIELCIGRSFKDLKADPSVLIGMRPDTLAAGGDRAILDILITKVRNDVGPEFGNAVNRCLYCPYDGQSHETDLKLSDFRKWFFEGIVAPVQTTYRRFSGLI